MKVTKEKMENSQIALNVEMETSELDEYLDKAYNKLVGKVRVPGFRKGKTPRSVLERHIGTETLFQEALEQLVPESYQKALEEQEVEPIARPEIELIQNDPVIYKAIVPVKPEVKLGDYTGVRVESGKVKVAKKEIDATLDQLLNQHAVLKPVDRPSMMNDVVTMDIEGEGQGESILLRKDLEFELVKESPLPLPGFSEKLVGINKGEEKMIYLSYSSKYKIESLAGKGYTFKVNIKEIKTKELPEANNDFAVSLGSKNMVSLRNEISENLKSRAEEQARIEFEQKIVDAVVEQSEVEYPPILVDMEISRILEEEARNFPEGINGLERYLESANKTMDDHKEELRPSAEERVVHSIVLEEICRAEKIEVSDSEINEEIAKITETSNDNIEQVKQLFQMPQARQSVNQMLLARKTMDRLKEIASGKN
jgi:trigger factor